MLTHSKQSDGKNTKTGSKNASTAVTCTSRSNVKFNTMTIYADSSLNKSANESFTIYSSGNGNGNRTAPETFQIYSVGNSEDTDGVQTFTLYSAASNVEEPSGIRSSTAHLSAVTL